MLDNLVSVSGLRVSCDPGDANFYSNPYPIYDEMRCLGPCFFWKEYKIWCFSSHHWVNSILRDKRFGRQMADIDLIANVPEHLKPFYEFESCSILELEPPSHTRLRRLINRAFISRKIETMRAGIVQLAHELIDKFEPLGQVDLLPHYAQIIPVAIISDLLGISNRYADQLLSWSHKMVAMYQHNRSQQIEFEAVQATREFSSFISDIIAIRRKNPKDDLISHLISEQHSGAQISDAEMITTSILLLNAGHEATVHAIGNGVKALLENFEVPGKLFGDDNINGAICEEVMRFDPPLHKFTRFVLEDLEIEGQNFKKGDVVGLLLGAANRDCEKFENPHELSFERSGLVASNMAFGAGIHFCVGAPLARLEMQIALPILFERLPGLRFNGQPKYADRYHFHGLEALNLKWEPKH